MVIWLSRPRSAENAEGAPVRFGVDGDIVPREVFGTLAAIEDVYGQAEAERQALLAATHIECDNLYQAAKEAVAAQRETAARERALATEEGYEEGVVRGHAEWLQRVLTLSVEAKTLQQSMRERMAELVTLAVEQIVRGAGAAALFARALDAIDRIVDGSVNLRIAVHPDDLGAARDIFGDLETRMQALGRSVALAVVADARLAAGSCVCESDLGIVDASLDTQLDAMRAAIVRALRTSMTDTTSQDSGASPPDSKRDTQHAHDGEAEASGAEVSDAASMATEGPDAIDCTHATVTTGPISR